MEFKKYGEIENSYRKKVIEEVIKQELKDGMWVVHEKIHGSNMSVFFNGSDIAYAKRTDFIDIDTAFYSWQAAMKRDNIEEKIKKLWSGFNLFSDIKLEELRLIGELFGGDYKHKDVKKVKEGMVQKGVFYASEQHFMCFDITVNGKIIAHDLFEKLMEYAEVKTAPKLFTGSFDEVMDFPNNNFSVVYKEYNLPEIVDNIMEGVVIKSIEPKFFGNHQRVILKNKNEKFKERTANKKRIKKLPKELSEDEVNVIHEIGGYVTDNRLRNVISKIGNISDKMFGVLIKNLNKDIMEEFMKSDEIAIYNNLDKASKNIVNKELNRLCTTLIRTNFLNIVDGVF